MNALLLAVVLALPARALDVVCTLPWLGDIARRLAPDAEVTVLVRGMEDPHYLSPTPALMAKVSRADIFVENGLSLETWAERLLDGAGNPRIRPGQPGFVQASDAVPRLEVPTDLNRARGDLHPEGNPHVWLDPLNAAIAADNIAAGLGRIDPAGAARYREAASAFRAEVDRRLFGDDLVAFVGGGALERLARGGELWDFLASQGLEERLGGWLAAGARGRKVVWYHPNGVYLNDRFGIVQVGTIEDRPGVAPSAAHKQRLATAMRSGGCDLVAVTVYYDDRVARALGEQTGCRVARVPGDVGGTPQAADYFALIDVLLAEVAR